MHQVAIKMLYVEDDTDLREIMEEELKASGVNVITASNGVEALNYLKSQTVDVVISDLKMPEVDGVGLRRLAEQGKRPTPQVWIAYTGYSDLDASELAKIGFDEVFYKPLNPELLVNCCRKMLIDKSAKT